MNAVARIDSLGGPIAAEIRNAKADDLRPIAIAIAELALTKFPDLPAVFREGTQQRRVGTIDPTTRERLSTAADELDETYLDMQFAEKPGGRTQGWERAAGLARAAFAVRFALDDDPRVAAAEATYEMVFALDDYNAVLSAITAAKSRDVRQR